MAIKSVAAVLSLLAFAFAISATFAPAWRSKHGQVFQGFFGMCVRGSCYYNTNLLNVSSGRIASAAFMIIGTLVLLAGSITVTMGMVNSQQSLLKTGGVVTLIGGVATLIGLAIFAGIHPVTSPVTYSASFTLALLATLFGITGGALAIKAADE